MNKTLTVEDLHVEFNTHNGTISAVDGVSFEVTPGEVVGLVGESGCGKTVTARSLVRLEDQGTITHGKIYFDGTDLTQAEDHVLERIRSTELASVFQDPSAALDPAYTVGEQVAEALRTRRTSSPQSVLRELVADMRLLSGASKSETAVLEFMAEAGIEQPEKWVNSYPHELSGGQCQRVLVAAAIARRPSLLIADEPTTALDTTTEAALLDRLDRLTESREMSMLFITHDFGVVAEVCDRIAVMYDGKIVERGAVDDLLSNPKHPYTKSLLHSIPQRSKPGTTLPSIAEDRQEHLERPPGCAFANRCPKSTDHCRETAQPSVSVSESHTVRCSVPDARAASARQLAGVSAQPTRTDVRTGDANGHTRRWNGGGHRSDTEGGDTRDDPVVEVSRVTKSFRHTESFVERFVGTAKSTTAVENVSLSLRSGQTMGLVGESGSGKSTLIELIAGLETPTTGTVQLNGELVGDIDSRTTVQRGEIGVVFQNHRQSINPRQSISEAIAEPLVEHGWNRERCQSRVETLLSEVGLPISYADRSPRQLSGGQLQRIAIARALALRPSVVLLDEPTASLDASTQAAVLNLLGSLLSEHGLAYIIVTHDLAVVRHVSDHIAVMQEGQFAETGPVEEVLSNPTHSHTRTLLNAIPGEKTEATASLVRNS
ncbi:ABC transporter ATP-binding protein [Halococcus sp. IIIV-5B]|uniref:dipeptide ABC transporter ATP-binding protein n=1 Tax=Halococcus sp. IIIV-5B TaxID=2321230 RepID=UPI000E749207|nr:ABC transporter ATP-binding protein [Halococcus sp. IIIV-5B]RJT07418.1 ABC transporter ATP-binding protein [Halococcus sp. IIIV-5B]